MDKDKNNRKKKQESNDILGMIRKHQQQPEVGRDPHANLRKFLSNLDDGVCEEEYTEAPLYKLGYDDGFNEAEEMFSEKLGRLRHDLKTMLTRY